MCLRIYYASLFASTSPLFEVSLFFLFIADAFLTLKFNPAYAVRWTRIHEPRQLIVKTSSLKLEFEDRMFCVRLRIRRCFKKCHRCQCGTTPVYLPLVDIAIGNSRVSMSV